MHLLCPPIRNSNCFIALIIFEQKLSHSNLIKGYSCGFGPLVDDVFGAVSKAADLQRTHLGVQRELLQVHGAACPNCKTLKFAGKGTFYVTDNHIASDFRFARLRKRICRPQSLFSFLSIIFDKVIFHS